MGQDSASPCAIGRFGLEAGPVSQAVSEFLADRKVTKVRGGWCAMP